MPVVLTDGRPVGQTYGYVITKISRIDRLPHFLRCGVALSHVSRAQGASLSVDFLCETLYQLYYSITSLYEINAL